MTKSVRELDMPRLPAGYFWDNRLEKNDGHQSCAIRIVGPDQCIKSKARIDLEMYGLAGVLERAQRMAAALEAPHAQCLRCGNTEPHQCARPKEGK